MQIYVLLAAAMALFSMPTVKHMRAVRTRLHLNGLIQVHHVIPKQFKHLLPAGVEINEPQNLIFMVTRAGKEVMNVRPTRLVHDGGHPAYNSYVGLALRHLGSDDAAGVRYLRGQLRRRLRNDDPDLPWTKPIKN
jgi:A nuclease family of the HNH/ENDO VII superfamily with conserved AHH